MPLLLAVLLLFGPKEAISGKFVKHSAEYRALHPRVPEPLPDPLPAGAEALAALIERENEDARLFAALGEALFRRGEDALAFRAFDRAQRMGLEGMQARKDATRTEVSKETIRREEAEAKRWVDALQEFERRCIAEGRNPDELERFFRYYGRPEQSLEAHIRIRRLSFAAGAAGVLMGLAFLAAAGSVPRRAALAPLLTAAGLAAGPAVFGQTGLFLVGAAGALLGGAAVLLRGKK